MSRSRCGVLRGLHYQIEHTQGKLVRCTAGSVFDVAVDLRKSSNTFGRWIGQVLSEENKHSMWIPPGFAHGFLTLSASADFQYKCTDIYHPESERTIQWDDSTIAIEWPPIDGVDYALSKKDSSSGVAFDEAETFD